MTTDMHEPPAPPIETPRRSPALLWLIAAAMVLVVTVAVATAIALSDNDSNDSNAVGTQQLASIRRACAQWHDSYNGSSTPPPAWCDDMIGWMTDQARSGDMTGSRMWSNPAQMQATCEQWMSQANGSTQDTSAWCSQMVAWMTDHMGDWNHWDQGWMMNGSMMGR